MDNLRFIEEINKISDENKIKIFDSTEIYQIEPIQTVLINSDFDIYSEVNREILHRLIVDRGYYSSYEPCTYPGVNIKYMYNNLYDKCGICKCDCNCNGKGEGLGIGDCKRVTIAVFNSGKIIITGGKSKEQLIESYNFITNVLSDRKKFIIK